MKKLAALLAIAFVLSGCGVIAQRRLQEAMRQADAIKAECRQRRLAGELKGYAESARCSNDRMRQVIAESGYPHMDLVDLDLAYNMALAERVDKGQLSEAEARLQAAELRTRITSEEQRRNIAAYQTQLQAQQAWNQWLQTWNQQQQNERIIQSLETPRTMAPITCYQFGNMVQCH